MRLLLLLLLFVSCCLHAFSANVMAPLLVQDRDTFRQQLQIAKQIGVEGVSVDVWWGLVEERGDQQFNWQYYDEIFADIRGAGLKIMPIIAFHQCGGNVGDDCDVPLPAWVWQHFRPQGLTVADLQYQSEYGNRSIETLALWADPWVMPQYIEFMQAFVSQYGALAKDISEINISMGPAGELRYPSYNSHDGSRTAYPSRGGFQAYSALAVADFRASMQQRYQHIDQLNLVWQTAFRSFEQLGPPPDAEAFIKSGAQFNSVYGRDFINWYHSALVAHGQRMLKAAATAFDGVFSQTALGFKIPGIHWQMSSAGNFARSAELAAGLIDSQQAYSAENGYGYQQLVALAAEFSREQRPVVLHFTALEMDDNPGAPSYSLAKSLVQWLGAEAARQQVTLKGENALAAGVTHPQGWDNIDAVFTRDRYRGITILRLQQVSSGGLGQQRYQQLIERQKAISH